MKTAILMLATSFTLMAANQARVVQTNSAGDNVHVIDPATNRVVGVINDIEVPHGVTIAPDGSRIYITDEPLKTLDVVDAKTLKVINVPGEEKVTDRIQGSPAHGLAITPDHKMLWVTSKWYDYVAAYSLPDRKLLKIVPVGAHPEWLTIPPNGKSLHVAVAGKDATIVVDNKTMEVVATIPVGFVPKRNTSGMLQIQ